MALIEKCDKDAGVTRRGFMGAAGSAAVGAAIMYGAFSPATHAEASKAGFPWPYKKLDLHEVGMTAYENWYRDYCTYAVISGIIEPLRASVGGPYNDLPLEAFRWGHGGGVGWGMTCGTLMGAGMAVGFVVGKAGDKITNDVINYYATTELPVFKPMKPKGSFKNVSRSDSPLCHISVGRWMKKEGVKFFTPERKERCARLSADVAMETARLLNLWADGKYKPVHGSQAKTHGMTAQNNCSDCHGGSK